ncbi:MAG: DUF4348 domain-containing protein [Phocaeicola vulgatus]
MPTFIYNFASDENALQVSRIVFPLPKYTMEKKEHIEREQWKHDPLFSQAGLPIQFCSTRRRIWKRRKLRV